MFACIFFIHRVFLQSHNYQFSKYEHEAIAKNSFFCIEVYSCFFILHIERPYAFANLDVFHKRFSFVLIHVIPSFFCADGLYLALLKPYMIPSIFFNLSIMLVYGGRFILFGSFSLFSFFLFYSLYEIFCSYVSVVTLPLSFPILQCLAARKMN